MRRSIVRHGAATMTISLPSKWIKKHSLKKGDEINIEEKENSLIITTDQEKKINEIKIEISSTLESSIRTQITNAYRRGFNRLIVNFHDKSVFKIISETVDKNLLGFEIIKKSDKDCIIESVTEPSFEQFDNIFSKVFLNTEELFNIIEKYFNNLREDDFESISRKIMQYDNFCKRIISKKGVSDENFLTWQFHSSFVHATRELYHLLKYLKENKTKLNKFDFQQLEIAKKIFEIIKESYLNKDIKNIETLHDLEKKATYIKGYNSLKKSVNPIIIFHLMAATRHFYLCNSSLSGILLNLNN